MTTTPLSTSQTAVSLSAQMRDGSSAEHREAEGSTFVARMLDGQIDRAGYVAYLSRLRQIYEALERVGSALSEAPAAAAVVDPVLYRREALEADLAFWEGPVAGGAPDVVSPAAQAYVAGIEQTAQAPHRYLAHHYTRYLGDLSGGQAIGRVISRTFTLPDGLGVQFYRFAQVPKPKLYKDAYRARLDALELPEEVRAEVVEEVRVAFGLNQAVFDELGREFPANR